MENEFLKKAKEMLDAAGILYKNKQFSSCISRCYYCVFHAAYALLAKHNIPSEKRKHRFVISAFSREFTYRRKWFARETTTMMQELLTARNTADYSVDKFSEKETKRMLDKTQEIYNHIVKVYHEKTEGVKQANQADGGIGEEGISRP